jgi:hypothetical protein
MNKKTSWNNNNNSKIMKGETSMKPPIHIAISVVIKVDVFLLFVLFITILSLCM